jgi:hypothetical protein
VPEAVERFYAAVDILADSPEPRGTDAAMVYGALADALLKSGELEDAQAIAEENLEILNEHHDPEQVARTTSSHTGQYLQALLGSD